VDAQQIPNGGLFLGFSETFLGVLEEIGLLRLCLLEERSLLEFEVGQRSGDQKEHAKTGGGEVTYKVKMHSTLHYVQTATVDGDVAALFSKKGKIPASGGVYAPAVASVLYAAG
jgi:hypothetical protein